MLKIIKKKSLSNDVFQSDDYIFKNFGIKNDRLLNECHYLKLMGREFILIKDNIIKIKAINGNLAKKSDIDFNFIDSLIKEIRDFNLLEINLDFERNSLSLNFMNDELFWSNRLKDLSINNLIIEKTFLLIKNGAKVNVHGDLSYNNLLVNDKKINFIDFENSGNDNFIFDYSSFLSDKKIKKEIICYISSEINVEFDILITVTILHCLKLYEWNKWKFKKTNEIKYKKNLKLFNKNINYYLSFL